MTKKNGPRSLERGPFFFVTDYRVPTYCKR
jgi:hypothetical protein